ncbi:MAG: DUF1566 domain-containing protein [Gammaproteobacteria bacterium]|nr:DUF1566 domain-containing protein [Gammaproteobacteria bacterium]
MKTTFQIRSKTSRLASTLLGMMLTTASMPLWANTPPNLGQVFGTLLTGISNQLASHSDPLLTPQSISAMSPEDQQLFAQGMWHDPKTGLTWMRCVVGDTWNGSTCVSPIPSYAGNRHPTDTGYNLILKIAKLNYGGYNDWRIPSMEELLTIRRCMGGFPTSDNKRVTRLVQYPKNDGSTGTTTNVCPIQRDDHNTTYDIDTTIFPAAFDKGVSGVGFIYASNSPCHEGDNQGDIWSVELGNTGIRCRGKDESGYSSNRAYGLAVRGGNPTNDFKQDLADAMARQHLQDQQDAAVKAKADAQTAVERQRQQAANTVLQSKFAASRAQVAREGGAVLNVIRENGINPYSGGSLLKIAITAKTDAITINKLVFNRGNCGVGSWDDRGSHGAMTLRYGDMTRVVAFCNNVSEVKVESNLGAWTYSF